MDRRARGNSLAMRGLLGRQIASITDTLAKASQRRETELQQRAAQNPPIAHVPQLYPAPSPQSGPSMTSDTGSSGGSDSGISGVLFLGGQESTGQPPPSERAFEVFANTSSRLNFSYPQAIRGYGEDLDSNDDPRRMLAEMDRRKTDARQETFHPSVDHTERPVDIEKRSFLAKETIDGDESELATMLAELRKGVSWPGNGTVQHTGNDDPKRMLADLEEGRISSWERPVVQADDDDPRKMLADLEYGVSLADPKSPATDYDEDAEIDLEALGTRLADLLPSSHLEELWDSLLQTTKTPGIEQHLVPYAVAIQLESAQCRWMEANGWTTYLFSNSLPGNEAQREKDRMVQRAEEELNAIIQDALMHEEKDQIVEKSTRLPRRLIVSNIAADSGEEDLMLAFIDFAYDM